MTRKLAAFVFLFLACAWGLWIRVDTTLSDPNFDLCEPRGLLRSDPALLDYLSARIHAAGGRLPADFAAETRLQHPYVTDVPSEFPLGLEFLVAWMQARMGDVVPLHVTALCVSSLCAALFVLGIYGLVRELTASSAWATLATLVALFTPANYRTLGFLFVGEDLALPLFLFHLAWLASAVRSGRARDYLASGCLAGAAAATWHAASFVLTLELLAWTTWAVLRGTSPLRAPKTAWVLVAPALAGLCVPVLRASGWLVSPGAALALALFLAGGCERRGWLPPARLRAAVVLGSVGLVALFGVLAPTTYAHVHAVVWSKLRFLGRFPSDPSELPFDARLLWQGPFETLPLAGLVAWCGWPLAVLFGGALVSLGRRGASRGTGPFLCASTLLAASAGWMFARLAVLAGFLAPVAGVVVFARWPRRAWAYGCAGLLTVLQASTFAHFIAEHRIEWYLPASARAEFVALIEAVEQRVPRDEPILGDFVNSPALLAHLGNPIVLQPKYETDRSRRQAEAFLTAFFRGTSAELAALMRSRFRARYLLVDGYVLGQLSRATAGLRPGEPLRADSAAAALLSDADEALRAIPGFELLYRGRSGVPFADFRLFVLADER